MRPLLTLLCPLLLAAACGTRGPLTLPPRPEAPKPPAAAPTTVQEGADYGSKAPRESAR